MNNDDYDIQHTAEDFSGNWTARFSGLYSWLTYVKSCSVVFLCVYIYIIYTVYII